jgi:hypothetical protein
MSRKVVNGLIFPDGSVLTSANNPFSRAIAADPAHPAASLTSVASVPRYVRVTVGQIAAATHIGFLVVTSSGNVAVAVYRDNGSDAPGTLVHASGSTANPGTGQQTIAIGTTVSIGPGDWLAYAQDNATQVVRTPSASGILLPSWRLRSGAALTSLTFVTNPTTTTGAAQAPCLWAE